MSNRLPPSDVQSTGIWPLLLALSGDVFLVLLVLASGANNTLTTGPAGKGPLRRGQSHKYQNYARLRHKTVSPCGATILAGYCEGILFYLHICPPPEIRTGSGGAPKRAAQYSEPRFCCCIASFDSHMAPSSCTLCLGRRRPAPMYRPIFFGKPVSGRDTLEIWLISAIHQVCVKPIIHSRGIQL